MFKYTCYLDFLRFLGTKTKQLNGGVGMLTWKMVGGVKTESQGHSTFRNPSILISLSPKGRRKPSSSLEDASAWKSQVQDTYSPTLSSFLRFLSLLPSMLCFFPFLVPFSLFPSVSLASFPSSLSIRPFASPILGFPRTTSSST